MPVQPTTDRPSTHAGAEPFHAMQLFNNLDLNALRCKYWGAGKEVFGSSVLKRSNVFENALFVGGLLCLLIPDPLGIHRVEVSDEYTSDF